MSVCPSVPACLSVCSPLPKVLWCIRNYFESCFCPHSYHNFYKIIITNLKSLLIKYEFWYTDVAVTPCTFGTFLRICSEQLTTVNSIAWRASFSNRKNGYVYASSEFAYLTKQFFVPYYTSFICRGLSYWPVHRERSFVLLPYQQRIPHTSSLFL